MSPAERKELTSLRASGAAVLAIGLGITTLTAYVALGTVSTPVQLPLADQVEIAVVAPEGWKFVTRSAHDDRLLLFQREGTVWRSASHGSNAEPRNLFGISRDGRVQGPEAALLLERLSAGSWKSCDSEVTSCLEADRDVVRLRNTSPSPTLCGALGLALQPPVPWAWATLTRRPVMPSKIAVVEIEC